MRRSFFAAVFLLLLCAPTALAQESELDIRTREIAEQLQCKVCTNLSVQDSNSGMAEGIKQSIRKQLQEGKSEAEIKQYFVDVYGEGILLEPTRSGFNLLIWAQPALVLLIGMIVLGVAANLWTRNKPAPAAPEPTDDDLDRYDGLFREELRRTRERAG